MRKKKKQPLAYLKWIKLIDLDNNTNVLYLLYAQLTAFTLHHWMLLVATPKVDDYPYFTNEENEMQIGKIYFKFNPLI